LFYVYRMSSKNFTLQNKRVHLAYKTHLTQEQVDTILDKVSKWEVRKHSYCHETGKHDEEEIAYPHTHLLICCKQAIKTANARFFDIDGIHPNIQKVNDDKHENTVYTKYHHKEGILCVQVDLFPPNKPGDLKRTIAESSDLFDCVEKLGITVKSVLDVQCLRQAIALETQTYEHKHTHEEFNQPVIKEFTMMYIDGPSQMGKTQWALRHFENPLLVRCMDQLRKFKEGVHDGIVFDDMSFAHIPREACIHMVDWDEASDIHARYEDAHIPKYTRKIFTSNKEFTEAFPYDESKAIYNRFSHFLYIGNPLFATEGGDNIKRPRHLTFGTARPPKKPKVDTFSPYIEPHRIQ